MENLHLIIGLGNPGSDYAQTRHNAGFLVLDRLAAQWRLAWGTEKKFTSRTATTERNGKRVMLCEPQTFMNASGEAVAALTSFYQVTPRNMLVVVDDADLPLGQLRLRPSGSSGGHHGLESIEEHLGTRQFARLRVGIGRQDGQREITGHVLGKFNSTERELVARVFDRASQQAERWLDAGIDKAMTEFNGTIDGPDKESEKKQ
jgi:PTH1 family peptidyl-tRNA hydrolase